MTYLKTVFNKKVTPQSQAIPGSAQVANSAGGFSFAVDDWTRLARFLVLGAEGGSFYAGETTLTLENAEAVKRCCGADGPRVVRPAFASQGVAAGAAPLSSPPSIVDLLRQGTPVLGFPVLTGPGAATATPAPR